VASNPTLLRREGRRGFRRLVYLSALATLLVLASGAGAQTQTIVITPVITGTPGANGWYTSNVTVRWRFAPEPLATQGCDIRTLSADTPGTTLMCKATLDLSTWFTIEPTFKIDKTVPAVTMLLERQADANGWYNRPLSVSFTGTDATSGISICTSGRYAGPDNPSALLSGSCSDRAGNVAPSSFTFKYDSTAPTLSAVSVTHGNRSVRIGWRKSDDTQVVEVLRAPGRNGQGESAVYRGTANGFRDAGLIVGRRYEYRIVGVDQAANRVEHKVSLVATGPLLSPPPAGTVTRPPTLVWTPVKRATYYNVQIIRGRRVLSAWPERPSFRLRRTWLYKGRRYRLRPGTYRWYVWPGFGRISEARYTRRPLGSSTFVVRG
jgi:hypothetical protein